MLEGLTELGNHYAGAFLKCPGQTGLVFHVTIFRTQAIVETTDGSVYVRRNASNLPYNTPAKLAQLKLDKGIVTFENETVAMDPDLVTKSKTAKRFLANIAPSAAKRPTAWFKGELLLTGNNPLVAAVLLFADSPQAALPKRSAVKLYRYRTSKEGGRETLEGQPQTIEGALYDLIEGSVKATKKMVEGVKRLGTDGLEKITYPHETLHEIVTNAVLHRDYSIQTDIQIRVYDNRIEVESPGKFPGHVTSRNFPDNQAARNGKIVRLINKFPNPPNKDVGEGLNTAFEAMKKLRLKEPYVKETGNSLIFVIEHAPLASAEEIVLQYLDTHEMITNSVARDLTGIASENSMKEVFKKLNKRNIIERVPGLKGNKAAWKKVQA
jgi:ATP-dependent DNA helicase RecG